MPSPFEFHASKHLTEIVVTGGPCAGKSTFMRQALTTLATPHRRVLIVPEVPTQLFLAGLPDIAQLRADPTFDQGLQRVIFSFQLQQRHHFRNLANLVPEEEVLLLFDRAELDGSAYIPPAAFAEILSEARLSREQILESYQAILHLVSASVGAPAFYTLENNLARHSTLEAAVILEAKTLAAWTPHPHHLVVDNQAPQGEDGFLYKINRANAALLELLDQQA